MNQADQIIQRVNSPRDLPGVITDLVGTGIFRRNYASTFRIVDNEGGVRSSKTMSLAQLFILKFFSEKDVTLTIFRKTMPALKATAMRDVVGLMKKYGVYDERKHNKTENIYHDGNNLLEFVALDEEQKVRGRKRDYAWLNEANELEHEDFKQIILRTTKQLYLDHNPVEDDHWIATDVMTRADCEYIHSDYRDNTFLEPEIIKEIELMREGDPGYWNVFGLGLRPAQGSKIYQHYQLIDDFPEDLDEIIYGVDFGFNNPSAIIRVGRKENSWYWDELLYKTHLTNSMLIEECHALREAGFMTYSMTGYADSAEPDRIQEFCDAGFNLHPADKAVKPGIDFVKGRPLFITKRSTNLLDNMRKLLWKTTKDGKVLDEPVKLNDHGPDAGRYAEYTHGKELAIGGPNIRNLW